MTDRAAQPLRILTVCSHNRTRSVMMEALLQSMLDSRLSVGRATVRSSGFGPVDLPSIADAVEAMRRRGLDVSAHRSRSTTTALVDGADLILTAERDHVVRIAALSPSAFPRAMTLPEFLDRAADTHRDVVGTPRQWVEQVTAGRTAGNYLAAPVAEVADPTGSMPKVFERAAASIEQQCAQVAALLESVSRAT